MAKTGNQPRLLTAVMEAIANLKEGRGSTQKRIIDQVQCLLSANKMSFRNPVVHIKKALRHGVQTGLIKQKSGKFRLGLDSKDYAIFKNFQKLKIKKELPLREHRRGRRRRKRSRRRRRRRRKSGSPDEDASVTGSASGSISGTPEPSDRGRRRRRRRKGRRRGRRRTEERELSSGHRSSEPKEISPSSSNEQSKPEKERDRDRESEKNRKRERDEEDYNEKKIAEKGNLDDPTCGNPDCLCNIKQEMNDNVEQH